VPPFFVLGYKTWGTEIVLLQVSQLLLQGQLTQVGTQEHLHGRMLALTHGTHAQVGTQEHLHGRMLALTHAYMHRWAHKNICMDACLRLRMHTCTGGHGGVLCARVLPRDLLPPPCQGHRQGASLRLLG